jgi:hypothetical protein
MMVEDSHNSSTSDLPFHETPWIRALSLADLPIGFSLSNQIKELGIQSVSALIGFVEHDPVADEDHPDLIEALKEIIDSDSTFAAIDIDSAWKALCEQYEYVTVEKVAILRGCTVGSVIELASKAGIRGFEGSNPRQLILVPEPEDIDPEVARSNISHVEERIKLSLPEREFFVLSKRYKLEMSLQEIGDKMSLTRERVRQIESRAKNSLLGTCTVDELLKSLIPIHFAIESSGGSTSVSDLSQQLGVETFPVLATLEMFSQMSILANVQFVSKSGRHLSPTYLVRKAGRDVLFEHMDGFPEEMATDAIGSTGVAHGTDFVRRISESLAMPIQCTHSSVRDVLKGFEHRKLVTICRVQYSEEIEFGPWVTSADTPRSKQIVQAILKLGSDQSIASSIDVDGLPRFFHDESGVANHLIVDHIQSYFGVLTSQGGVDEVCRRFPGIFVRTGRTSWGLTGAGAQEYVNVEDDKLEHGTTINLLVSVLESSPNSLNFREIIQQMRAIEPSIREQSVRIYLNQIHADRFVEKNGYYTLSDLEEIRAETDLSFGVTIRVLLQVMENAERPLTEVEIIDRCQSISPVAGSALKGYLQQNYRNYFQKLDDGRFVRSEES